MTPLRLLAADIGGTNARLAMVQAGADGRLEVGTRRHYRCADHPSLEAIVADFIAAAGLPDAMAIAVAGTVDAERITSRNIPWPIVLESIRALGIAHVGAVNDFVAVAHAEQCMREQGTCLLTPAADAPATTGPTLVVGPGTGLGAALRVPFDGGTLVLPGEPQQMALAPGNRRELAVLQQWMDAGAGHVGYGEAISGPGLLRLYRSLCALAGVPPRLTSSDAVSGAADAGHDPHAVEAVQMFCGLFGSCVGDLVLATGATRVFVAGGVPLKILRFLLDGRFARRMTHRHIMQPALERVPVRLLQDPDLGVIGAASWWRSRPRHG